MVNAPMPSAPGRVSYPFKAANYTTTVLAFQAASRGHRVCYITPSDFVLNTDDSLFVHGRFLPKRKYKNRPELSRR